MPPAFLASPLLRKHRLWSVLFLIWLLALAWLSHGDRGLHPPTPPLPFFDKICHFGYFFGGAGLLSAALFFRRPTPNAKKLLLVVVLILAIVGVLDEYHQSFFPTRKGNDPFDWLADVSGALAGSLTFLRLQPRWLPRHAQIG